MNTVIRRLRGFTLTAALIAVATPVQAQHWAGAMSGANENPANPSTATGYIDVYLSGSFLTVNMFWQGLLGGNPAAAHIHCCVAPGSNVGVAVGFTSFPATTSGTYSNVFDLSDPTVYTAAFRNTFGGGTAAGAQAALINGMNAGNAYSNIHDATYPGGEIRANLVATPEPAAIGLTATGLIFLAGVSVRRRRQG
ncbi:MAG: CHRD domain-containing protein [Gemmatimonadaceae bacterium]